MRLKVEACDPRPPDRALRLAPGRRGPWPRGLPARERMSVDHPAVSEEVRQGLIGVGDQALTAEMSRSRSIAPLSRA